MNQEVISCGDRHMANRNSVQPSHGRERTGLNDDIAAAIFDTKTELPDRIDHAERHALERPGLRQRCCLPQEESGIASIGSWESAAGFPHRDRYRRGR